MKLIQVVFNEQGIVGVMQKWLRTRVPKRDGR